MDIKKTMQGDTSKLLRDKIINRTVSIINSSSIIKDKGQYKINKRLVVTYKITEYGWKIAQEYRLLAKS